MKAAGLVIEPGRFAYSAIGRLNIRHDNIPVERNSSAKIPATEKQRG